LHNAQITPAKILSIGECTRILAKTMAGYSVPQLHTEQIILLQAADAKSIQAYFEYYGSREKIRQKLAFSTIIEACGSKIPLSFFKQCVEQNSTNIPLYPETIRSLYAMGATSPEIWGKYTKNPQRLFTHWSPSDYLILTQTQPNDEVHAKACDYARDSILQLSATDCLRLARSKTAPSLENLRMYHTFLMGNSTQATPNKSDIVACAISGIPTERILEYRQAEKNIDSGYTPDTWSITHITEMYSAGVRPTESVNIWNRFSSDSPWKKFDCKREIRAELLAMPGFIALTDFLVHSPQSLLIGKKSFELKNNDGSIGFMR
jgi:hypothetical protein